MRKIYLNEQQFKNYVKHTMNENLVDMLKAKKEAKANVQKNQLADLKKKLDEWGDLWEDDIKYSDSDLYIGTDTTPLTFKEWLDKHGFATSKAPIALKQIMSKGRANIMGMSLSAEKDAKNNPENLKHHRKETEDVNDFKRRHLSGEAAKNEFDHKTELDAQDELFKQKLGEMANNNVRDENGNTKLPTSDQDAQTLAQDNEFLLLKKFCDENRIICSDTGDIYIPVKSRLTKEQEQATKLKEYITNGLSKNLEWQRLQNLMARFGPKGWISAPHKSYAGFGGNLESRIIWIEYIPKELRRR